MDFKLLDAGDFYKLEQVGGYIFHRPSPAAVWAKNSDHPGYQNIDAKYERYSEGKGSWKIYNKNLPKTFEIKVLNLKLQLQLTSFGHLGLFAEQFSNWKRLSQIVKPQDKVLNLFAYTGVSSLICASCDAEVTHVDASKTSVQWAKKNQLFSELSDKKIRWIVEDVRKYVAREVRRQNTYDWIILDPPSFGRGTQNEAWYIEKDLLPLMRNLAQLKSKDFKGILLSSHSPGYTPLALDNILVSSGFDEKHKVVEEMKIDGQGLPLPSGFSSWRSSFQFT